MNYNRLEIVKIEGKNIVLNKWNGEIYYDCFEIADNLINIIDDNIEVKPIYKKVNEDEFEIIGYEIL